jgi:hypothetical protein
VKIFKVFLGGFLVFWEKGFFSRFRVLSFSVLAALDD